MTTRNSLPRELGENLVAFTREFNEAVRRRVAGLSATPEIRRLTETLEFLASEFVSQVYHEIARNTPRAMPRKQARTAYSGRGEQADTMRKEQP